MTRDPVDAVSLFSLTGKVALVTGGTRGLGRAIAIGFAVAGADLVIVSRDPQRCDEVADEVRALGRRVLPRPCHVGHWNEIDALVADAYDHFGRVDVLVNNAGKSPVYDSLATLDERAVDSVLNLNFKGPFRLASLIGQRMFDGRGGSIVNVSSAGAVKPSPAAVPYASAKAALNTMTIAMAKVFAPHVRVNAILPGPFLTDIAKGWDMAAFEERARTSIALGRGGLPNEIVGAALYLATQASSYTTGALISVDGGSTL